MVYVVFFGQSSVKWSVINVALLLLKKATQNTRLMGYFPILLMKLFELYRFELDINTNWTYLLVYFCSSELHFYEIAFNDFKDCILE